MTANDRHAIPPFPPSHATVPSPDKLSQHTFQFVDAQRLFRDQFVALVDDELRLGELRKRILRFRCRRLRIIAHKIMMPNDAQVVAVHPLAVAAVSFLLLFQRAMHRSMRLYPMSFGSRPASRKMADGDSPAL